MSEKLAVPQGFGWFQWACITILIAFCVGIVAVVTVAQRREQKGKVAMDLSKIQETRHQHKAS